MKRISIPELEKMMQTTYVCTQKIKLSDSVLGDGNKHILEFDIFDGFAYCADYRGKEYYMIYPRKEFIALAKDAETKIREYLNLPETTPIEVEHILASFNSLYVNE